MILADENIHGFIIKTLREAGIEVISVAQTAKGNCSHTGAFTQHSNIGTPILCYHNNKENTNKAIVGSIF